MHFQMKTGISRIVFPIAFLLSLLCSSCADKSTGEIESRVEIVQKSMQHHSLDSLRPYLASGYTVKGLPQGFEALVLSELFKKMPAPKGYVITKTSEEKRGTRLKATFYFENIDSLHANFLIAKDGQFLELNLLDSADIKTAADSVPAQTEKDSKPQ
ncbi:hypothetical protein [Flavobacterium silvaticum]|uniref:DUF3887 domain-containing protein n=1 Tax=Flavobacterium silvaticum TaxID=1852020 RepID=A0A972FLH4_9FLAO|nr:hypothetical protein [Flavobacterium silvaticum]NMH27430.1 hypothetical protein [Flavobacterium silvaticum]